MVTHIKDKADLDSKLADAGDQLVVIDFFATWCGPCKAISPKLEELAKEHANVLILKVDVDECEDIAMEYNISSMPTFIFIKRKETITSFSGANYEKLKALVLEHK
ncbi:thioredoxin-2 isoform X2 [Coccinella septempunctata]|uniref:thioredoxin-2 isoform X2 n=1 Tax=Coccinella septempunctata TaxID=41139 RepID=UPI001D077FB0|nr:thioredoxin-2 isoform X2 [Coccinella septempunctata]